MKKDINEIAAWFNGGCDFDRGISLLEKYNSNTFYVSNIKRRRNSKTLSYELNKILVRSGGKLKPVSKVSKRPVIKRVVKKKETGKIISKGFSKSSKPAKEQAVSTEQRGIVLRNEFPFLHDSGCPEELKILVADMITAHSKYVLGHEKLFDVAHKGDEACFDVARETVENYLENRAIWEELEHYKKTGRILGNHKIFERRKREQEIYKLDEKGLKRLLSNLKKRIKYRIDKVDGNTDKFLKYKEELLKFRHEYTLVDELIKERHG